MQLVGTAISSIGLLRKPSDLDADTGARFIAGRDLARTFSCLAATEPTGACGCRRRRLEAQESLDQQMHPLRRSQFHCYRLRCGRRKSHRLGKTGIETSLRDPRHERTRWRCRRLRTARRSWPGPRRHCRSFAGKRGNGRGQLPVVRHGPGCAIVRMNKRRFGRTLDESRRVVRRPTHDTRRLREYHFLNDHRHANLPVIYAVLKAVYDRPAGKKGCPAFADMLQDLILSDNVQVSILLPRK